MSVLALSSRAGLLLQLCYPPEVTCVALLVPSSSTNVQKAVPPWWSFASGDVPGMSACILRIACARSSSLLNKREGRRYKSSGMLAEGSTPLSKIILSTSSRRLSDVICGHLLPKNTIKTRSNVNIGDRLCRQVDAEDIAGWRSMLGAPCHLQSFRFSAGHRFWGVLQEFSYFVPRNADLKDDGVIEPRSSTLL